jgi:multiple sugar transport system ATP-binding protein
MDVQFEQLTKKFGGVTALDDFTLYVPDGEFLVLLGPSGCGKTTALRCLAGLEKPSSGLMRIGGKVVNRLQPRDRDVALVFQSYALYPQMTVGHNIMYPLRIRRVPMEKRLEMAHDVARRLEIDQLFDRRPNQLSGGQRQRVALARAIVRNPNVFLMDEPLSNLDARLRVNMRAELKHLQETLSTTTIYVTHDQAEAMTMADRIAIMRDGRLEQVGMPDEIYFSPETVYVAGFVGSPAMNLLDVRYDPVANVLAGDGFTVAPAMALALVTDTKSKGGNYVLGIRPEHLTLSFDAPHASIAGTIYAVEPMGSETLVYVKVSQSIVVVRADAMLRAAVNTPCWLELREDRLLVFDKSTERRLGKPSFEPRNVSQTFRTP